MEQTSNSAKDSSTSLARQSEELKKNLARTLSSTRVTLCQKIALKFPHFQGFLAEYSSNMSLTGIFVRCASPEPPGTLVAFEFLLPEGVKLIRGQAEVVWIRTEDEGPDRPAGMGLRFVRLDAESRRLIRWTVEKQLAETGSLVELKDLRGPGKHGVNGREVDLRKMYPYAGAAMARPRRARRRYGASSAPMFVSAAMLFVSGMSAGLFYSAQARAVPAAEAAVAAAVETAVAAAAEAAVPAAPASASAPAPSGPPEPSHAELLGTVEAWARAWSEQRAGDYLAFYSPDFQPPQKIHRADWDAIRRSRISRPRFIRLSTAELKAEFLGPRRARVAFLQVYESDTYRDTVRKTLELTLEGGQWKILDEWSEPLPPASEPRQVASSEPWHQPALRAASGTVRHAKVAGSSVLRQ